MKQQAALPGIAMPESPAGTLKDPADALSALGENNAPEGNGAESWPPLDVMLQSCLMVETTRSVPPPITVLGVDCGRPRALDALDPERRRLLKSADIVCAGRALLETLAGRSLRPGEDEAAGGAGAHDGAGELRARLLALHAPLESLFNRLSQWRAQGKRILVLADGDPLLYGVGATLARHLGQGAVRLLPAVSSLQQACARLAVPWHKVVCLSRHGRGDLRPLNAACGRGVPLCVLTDERMSPDVLARHLLDRGVDWFRAHVFERMGAADEAAYSLNLAEVAERAFGPACTMLLLPEAPPRRPRLGLDMADLVTDRGLASKKPVRAAALSLLCLEPRHTVWDIGAGSGAVALEAAALAHDGVVIAVERSSGRAMAIQENRRRLGAAIVEVRLGQAPDCLAALPDPDRVFIGGGLSDDGGNILRHVSARLPEGGRVVAACALLDSLHLCLRFFEEQGWPVEMQQISAAEGAPLGGGTHLAALNPVFLVGARKPCGELPGRTAGRRGIA